MKLSAIRVPSGYVVGALTLALARPTSQSLLLGAAFVVLGELVRLWASGHIEKTERLATGGPYAHTRNPLYVGSSLLALGIAVAAASPSVVAAVVIYFALFYPAVIREESNFLRQKFGPDYDTWSAAVPAFFPRLTPGGPRTTHFSWSRIRKNREWRTVLALPILALLLYLRTRL